MIRTTSLNIIGILIHNNLNNDPCEPAVQTTPIHPFSPPNALHLCLLLTFCRLLLEAHLQ